MQQTRMAQPALQVLQESRIVRNFKVTKNICGTTHPVEAKMKICNLLLQSDQLQTRTNQMSLHVSFTLLPHLTTPQAALPPESVPTEWTLKSKTPPQSPPPLCVAGGGQLNCG